ncbi:MAG: hypothetical protein HY683_01530 [Chloroflexi bacterium]|nr:hypothetical protein [Chloroflexota bacterium]
MKQREDRHDGRDALLVRVWTLLAVILGLVALVIYVLSFLAEERYGAEVFLTRFLKDGGLALLTAAVVALLLDRLVHESLLDRVRRAVDSVDTALAGLREASYVLAGASAFGIEDIFARREDESRVRFGEKLKSAILKEAENPQGEIRIACVAGPTMFTHDTSMGKWLWNCMADPNHTCSLKVLLLCPSSKWAGLRAELEPGHTVIDDIVGCGQYLSDLKQANGKVEFRCYDFPPIAFLIITHDQIFVEGYPMLRLTKAEGAIGGKTPMLLARKDTETFRRWTGHFDYLYNEQSVDYKQHGPQHPTRQAPRWHQATGPVAGP